MRKHWVVFLLAVMLCPAQAVRGDTVLTLRNDLVDRLKSRVTVTESFFLDAAGSVHEDADDGEIHMAVRSADIGFACVAEIMDMHRLDHDSNNTVSKMIRKRVKEGTAAPITGVWRFWSEHGKGTFTQNSKIKRFSNSNPNHMFEIHPVLEMGGRRFLDTYHTLAGFDLTKKKARTRSAFSFFENIKAKAVRGETATKITSQDHNYNFVDFRALVTTAEPTQLEDGALVEVDVFDWSDSELTHPLATGVRLVFTKETAPYQALLDAFASGSGDQPRLHVVGFPRVSLAVIDEKLTAGNGAWQGRLPYEIIVTGSFPE